jgi:hypothetical protein
MFREYLHRTYRVPTRGRKRRVSRIRRNSRPAAARLAIEGLEERTLLSTLTLTNGALVYTPSINIFTAVTISADQGTQRYTFGDTAETITLVGNFINPSGNHTHSVSFGAGNITSITVNDMPNKDMNVIINQTLASAAVTLNLSNGHDQVSISYAARNLDTIHGPINVHAGSRAFVDIRDDFNTAGQTFTMGASSLSRPGAAPITWGSGVGFVALTGGLGNNTYNVSGTEPTYTTTLFTNNGHQDVVNVNGTGSSGTFTVNGGTGMDTVNVRATNCPVFVSSAGPTTVTVGNAGSVQQILGPVTIHDQSLGARFAVTVDDSADPSSRNVTHDTVTINGLAYGRINGLAPAGIFYRYADTDSLTVQTGTGAATAVRVQSTGVPVNLVGHASGTVAVGNGGSVQAIKGAVTISDPPAGAYATVIVDDFADSTFRTVSLAMATIGGFNFGVVTGLAPADIRYKSLDTNTVTIETGTGGATVNVLATLKPISLVGYGSNTVNVGNAGSVQAINSPLTISGSTGSHATLNVDDSADGIARTVYLGTVTIGGSDYGQITGLGSAPIQYRYANTNTATVQTGTGGATVNVLATAVPVSLIVHSFNTTVNVGNAGSVQAINGSLTITDPPSYATVNVDDSADGSTRIVTLDTVTIGGLDYGRITGLAPAAIQYKYADTYTVTVETGAGGATVNALTAARPINLIGNPSGPISLFASDAANTWTITGQNAGTLSSSLLAGTVTFSGAPILHGGNGADFFVFADGAGVDGTIDGGGGTNALDYSAYSSSVLVDLQTGSATGVGGGIANIQNVTGGTGGGAGVYNILVGNGGNVLTGGDGRRNLLIAGASASTLIGGNDDDILIGGTTAYDTEAGLLSLQAIMNYWSTTADDYGTRVGNLLTGNGVPLLDATMVTNNGGGNTLMGNHGGGGEMNLFYGLDPTLETTDYNPAIGEQFINC